MALLPKKEKSWNPNGPDYKPSPLRHGGTIEVSSGPASVGPVTAESRISVNGHEVFLSKGVRDYVATMQASMIEASVLLQYWQVVGHRDDHGITAEVFKSKVLPVKEEAWQTVLRLLATQPPELFVPSAQIIVYFQGKGQVEYFLINADVALGLSVMTMVTTRLRGWNKHTRVVCRQ